MSRQRVGGGRANTAKADVLVPVLGLVPVPVRGTQVPGIIPRGAAADDVTKATALCTPVAIIIPDAGGAANPPTAGLNYPCILDNAAAGIRSSG